MKIQVELNLEDVFDNMRKQNMLKEDKIAELLKDNPNEK